MITPMLWALNPNLTEADRMRLEKNYWAGKERCLDTIKEGMRKLPSEAQAEYLSFCMSIMMSW
ncbi:MAG: hypothetical protein ACREQ5_03785 [Candidatus Dormibacteria bacterium]